jgi:hypothetical protein
MALDGISLLHVVVPGGTSNTDKSDVKDQALLGKEFFTDEKLTPK